MFFYNGVCYVSYNISGSYINKMKFKVDYDATFSDANKAKGSDLRIMSYNIYAQEYSGITTSSRVGHLKDILYNYMPDVIGIQEVDTPWHTSIVSNITAAGLYDFACKTTSSGLDNMTTMLYNKNTVKLVEEYVVDLDAGSDIRVFSVAVFQRLSDGKQFVAINTHPAPSSRQEEYPRHMNRIAELVNETQDKYKNLPIIMTCDFNTKEQSSYYADFIINTGIKDAKYEADTLLNDYCTYSGINVKPKPGSANCIDHIFVNKRVGVKTFATVVDASIETLSDHIPICADIVLKDAPQTKVACIGDSLTAGHTWAGEAYPVYLSQKLGTSFTVNNYGYNGVSVTGLAPNYYLAYKDTTQYTSSINLNPDVVVMMLGTNDSKALDEDLYKEMYIDLINSYKKNNPSVKIILVTSPPALENNGFSINTTAIEKKIRPIQLEIAKELGLTLIDLYKAMSDYEGGIEALVREGDGVHLSVEGANLLAELVEEAIYDTLNANVVDLAIFMVQSNMAGRGEVEKATKLPVGHGYEFRAVTDPTKLYAVTEPFGENENNAAISDSKHAGKGSMISALMESYYQETGVPIVGVFAAQGGTATSFWAPGGIPLNEAIARYKAAEKYLLDNGYTIRNRYMVWCQGESDGDANVSTATYKTNLKAIIDEMFAQGIEDAMIVRIGNKNGDATKYDKIIAAQTELCKENKNIVLVSTSFAGMVDKMKDEFHYYQEGYEIVGEEAGKNMAYYVNTGLEPSLYDPEYDNTYVPNN